MLGEFPLDSKNAAIRRMDLLKVSATFSIPALLLAAATAMPAAQLTTDARTAIPHEVQQLVVIDYRAMQNSTAAMDLRERVMPPELKQFDEALRKSGLNDNHDVDSLAFALFRPGSSRDQVVTVGVAQGQFDVQDIVANFRKQRLKGTFSAPTAFIRLPKPAWSLALSTPPPWFSAPPTQCRKLWMPAMASVPTC